MYNAMGEVHACATSADAIPTEFMPQPREIALLVSAVSPSMNSTIGGEAFRTIEQHFDFVLSQARADDVSAFIIIGSKWSQSSGSRPNSKDLVKNSRRLIGLPMGSKQPTNSPPLSSRI